MRTWFLWCALVTPALAGQPVADGEEVAEDAMTDLAEEPEVRTRTVAGLPTAMIEELTFPVSCTVEVHVNYMGHPTQVDACPDAVVSKVARQAFATWRWGRAPRGQEDVHRYEVVWTDADASFAASWISSDRVAAVHRAPSQLPKPPADGIRGMHESEVTVKRRVPPEYPALARGMDLPPTACRVRVFIDRLGKPFQVKPVACPKVFHGSVEDALMQWRWYPPRGPDGEKVEASITITVVYKLE